MKPAIVFQKTNKGREEIEKRTLHVDFKRRTLLIMVNGSSDAKTVAGKTTHLGDSMGLLQSLWSDGFIEPTGEFAGLSAAASADANTPDRVSDKTLDELQHIASAAIEKLMGPDGDTFAVKLERTSTPEEFMEEARKTRDALRSFLGARQADAFWKALGF